MTHRRLPNEYKSFTCYFVPSIVKPLYWARLTDRKTDVLWNNSSKAQPSVMKIYSIFIFNISTKTTVKRP